MSVEVALCWLLLERPFRESFLRGDLGALGLSASELDQLSTIDAEQLCQASRLACDGLLNRSHRGTGSIVSSFPETIDAWKRDNAGAGLDVLADAFAASPHVARYRALPTCEEGISLEEAFWRFADDQSIGDPAIRLEECATTLLKALAITREPSFALPPFVAKAPRGFFVILGHDEPLLLAATEGRFIRGSITRFLAELLVSNAPPAEVGARFGVSTQELGRSCEELRRLGLLV
jgi:hypothetical protein